MLPPRGASSIAASRRRIERTRTNRATEERAPLRAGPGLAVALLVGLLATGCSQAPQPELPPETPASQPESSADRADTEDAAAAEASSEQTEPAADTGEEERDPSVILIETGTPRRGKPSLWEAAVAARESRKTARPPVASVTNENLHEYQDAELTFAEPAAKSDGEQAEDGAAGEEGTGEEDDEAEDAPPETLGEQYWRNLVRDIRLRMRTAVDEIDELEAEAASLRRSFYAEDDPYVRDGQIKPAWDRAIGRLASTRRRMQSLRQELEEALEDGRRAGALAGWLREGIELEPSFEEERSAAGQIDGGGLSIHESQELDTVEPEEPSNTTPEDPPP